MIYFTSDPHVFHKNILKYDELPFGTIEEYRKFFVDRWNSQVNDTDEVYLLGDVCVGGTSSQIKEFLFSLKGKIYLIRGNHDKDILKNKPVHSRFEWIKDYHHFDYNNTRFVLMHYPIESWLNKSHGSIHLHGHSHGGTKSVGIKRMDVGFKACDFQILSIDRIISIMKIE